jgi:hypothetical protein
MGERFGEKPSARFDIGCEVTAFAFDWAAAYTLQRAEARNEIAMAEAMAGLNPSAPTKKTDVEYY